GQEAHVEEVDRRHLRRLLGGAGDAGSDLRPAAGRGAEVDDAARTLEDLVLLVDLEQLVDGALAVALELGALHVGVVQMPLQPAAGGGLELALLHLLADLAAAGAGPCRRLRHGAGLWAASSRRRALCRRVARCQAPSSAIISFKSPSRRPRSATRMRSEGQ